MVYLLIGLIGSLIPLIIMGVMGVICSKAVNTAEIKKNLKIIIPSLVVAALFTAFLFVYCLIAKQWWAFAAVVFAFIEVLVACVGKSTFIDGQAQVKVIVNYSLWHASAVAVALIAIALARLL